MAAVRALFDRYKLIAAKRPPGHVVRYSSPCGLPWTDHAEDFDSEVMQSLELVDASPDGTVTYDMFMAPGFSNLNSTRACPAHGSS